MSNSSGLHQKGDLAWPSQRDVLVNAQIRAYQIGLLMMTLVTLFAVFKTFSIPVHEVEKEKVLVFDERLGGFTDTRDFDRDEFRADFKVTEKAIFDYVVWRARYNSNLFRDDYINVQLFSTEDEQQRYIEETKGTEHPRLRFKEGIERVVRIGSILPLSDGKVQIRYTTEDKSIESGKSGKKYSWTAIADYEYRNDAVQEYQDKANVLGFVISNYSYSLEGEIK